MARKPIPGRIKIGTAYGNLIAPNEVIGVRVYINIETTQGDLLEASITVNVAASETIADVMGASIDWAEAGNLGYRNNYRIEGTIVRAEIQQLILGGIDSPALNLI